MDTTRSERTLEAAEAQIDAFIERRARNGETDPDEREDLWVESVKRFNETRKRENTAAWYSYHMDQAERLKRTLEDLISRHESEAQKLLEPRLEPGEPGDDAA